MSDRYAMLFRKGDKVTLSDLAMKRRVSPIVAKRTNNFGIVHASKGEHVWLIWDGAKTVEKYYAPYIKHMGETS